MNKRAVVFVLGVIMGALICMGLTCEPKQETQDDGFRQEIISMSIRESQEIEKEFKPVETVSVKYIPPKKQEKREIYLNELDMLARCVEAEAGTQDLLGKRLVVDVILNRVDSSGFPNDIISVITQDGQFSVVGNGMIDLVEPSESTFEAIEMELEQRTDSEILYFRTGHPHSWCESSYQHGAHFFGW